MSSLASRIINHAASLPAATPICPASLLHMGNRAAVNQALSRLAKAAQLLRISPGVYMVPIEARFGPRAPKVEKAIAALSQLWGETIVSSGGAAANRLRLTTQVPVRPVYLTSGSARRLQCGALTVELRHAPRWQLAAAHSHAGELIRALAWLGPREVDDALRAVLPLLTAEDVAALSAARPVLPIWIAKPIPDYP